MPVRTSEARWDGTLREGHGVMKLGKNGWEGPYSFASRFEEGQGTNPEELIAAAHAGCFNMALSGILTDAGYPPNYVQTTAKVHIEKAGDGFAITQIDLDTRADVPGIDKDAFQAQAEAAKAGCPVSKALGGVANITLNAQLVTS